jgi:hypothetical protein
MSIRLDLVAFEAQRVSMQIEIIIDKIVHQPDADALVNSITIICQKNGGLI